MATTEAALPPDAPTDPTQSVSGLVSGILSDAQTLVRQQAEMLKAEMREDFRRSKRAAEFGSLGIVFATVGVMGLITALAYVLNERLDFPMWASWGIVGGLFAVVGAGLGWYSYILLERFNPLPDKTFNALKENITWTTK